MSGSCSCGLGVDNCNDDPHSLVYNYVIGYAFLLGLAGGAAYLLRHKEVRFFTKEEFSVVKSSDMYTSHFDIITPKHLLLFRFCMLIVSIFTVIDTFVVVGVYPMQTFTYWNWTLIGVYFLLATFVSFRAVKNNYDGSEEITMLDRFLCAIFEIELAGAILVTFLVWTVLLPGSFTIDREDDLLNRPSYFVHAVNMLMMLAELALNKIYIRKRGALFFLLWPVWYGFFHMTLMMIRDFIPEEKPCPVYPFLALASNYFFMWLLILSTGCAIAFIAAYKASQFKKRVYAEDKATSVRHEL